jgi:hypothetical protein
MFMSALIKRHRRQKDHRSAALSWLILGQPAKQRLQLLPPKPESNTLGDPFCHKPGKNTQI